MDHGRDPGVYHEGNNSVKEKSPEWWNNPKKNTEEASLFVKMTNSSLSRNVSYDRIGDRPILGDKKDC